MDENELSKRQQSIKKLKDAVQAAEQSRKLQNFEISADDITDQLSELHRFVANERNALEAQFLKKAKELELQTSQLQAELQIEREAAINAFTEGLATKEAVNLWLDKEQEHQIKCDSAQKAYFYGLLSIGATIIIIVLAIFGNPTAFGEILSPVGCNTTSPELCSGFSMRGMIVVTAFLALLTLGLWLSLIHI